MNTQILSLSTLSLSTLHPFNTRKPAMNTRILSLSTLILLTFTAACDSVDSASGDETCFDTGEAGDDNSDTDTDSDPETLEVRADSGSAEPIEPDENDETEQVCQLAPPPSLEPQFDAGICVRSGVAVGDCRSGSALYRPCDSEYLGWCESQSGSFVQADLDRAPATLAKCGVGPGELGCTSEFFSECATVFVGVPTCDDPQECLSAICHIPQEMTWCCEGSSQTGTGQGCVAGLLTCGEGQILLNCGSGETCIPNGDGSEMDCTCH